MTFGRLVSESVSVGGWVQVRYTGPNPASHEIALASKQPGEGDWQPAFYAATPDGPVVCVRAAEQGAWYVWARNAGWGAQQVGRVMVR